MTDQLAIDGGAPVRTEPFPSWPIFGNREEQLLLEVLHSGKWGELTGNKVTSFARDFAAFQAAAYGVCVPNGTLALEVGLQTLGVGFGDEIITTAYTFIATASSAFAVGARPIFVDIDPLTRNIDMERIERAITPATRAILPVDLAGLPVDRDRLDAIAAKYGLRVIEDAAQSFGSRWKGVPIGKKRTSNSSFGGDFVSFSFHPNKNITTIEGGCLVLNEEHEAKLAEQYRLQGVVRSGFDGMEVELVGGKFNLTDVAARVGLGQLDRLQEFTERRVSLARHYFSSLATTAARFGIELPVADFEQSNWHMFQVVLPEGRLDVQRAAVMAELDALGIGTGVHYPAIHLFKVYRRLGFKDGDFPIAERVCRNILSLPLFPAMTEAEVERVAAGLNEVLQRHLKR
jgi:dTDP-4-amino-4,6-dideoxygalactose transaminase